LLKNNPDAVSLEGLCTHYAGAEEYNSFDRVKNSSKHLMNFVHFSMMNASPLVINTVPARLPCLTFLKLFATWFE